jgi:hypothetical protein
MDGIGNNNYEPAWTRIRYASLDTPLEEDIKHTKNSLKDAEAITGKEWGESDMSLI